MTERNAIRERLASRDNPAVVEARARELGYVKPGELPLRVTGLDGLAPEPPAPRVEPGFWAWLPDL